MGALPGLRRGLRYALFGLLAGRPRHAHGRRPHLYFAEAAGFSDVGLHDLRTLAAEATGAIALAQRLADAEAYATDLQRAMRSRSAIDQAIGVIMAQQRCSAEDAFDLLRKASQHRNVKMRDLCVELLTSIAGKPPSEGTALPPRP